MGMVINTNLSALNTYNQLNKNGNLMNSALEKLSSGYRINSAADDAAGLAISEKMRGQIRGLDQASSNSQDAISLVQTAEGALEETTDILQRMRELAVQASSDTNTDADRANIQDEIDALVSEIDNIGNTTEFNTKELLNGNVGRAVSDSGGDAANFVDDGYSATSDTAAGVYTVTVTTAATAANIANATGLATSSLANTGTATITAANAGTLTINGSAVTITATDTLDSIVAKINNLSADTGVTAATAAATDTASAAKYAITLTQSTYGSSHTVQVSGSSALLQQLGLAVGSDTNTAISDAGTDAVYTMTDSSGAAIAQKSATGNKVTFSNGLTVEGLDGTVAASDTTSVIVSDANDLTFQIGANEGQTMSLSIGDMRAKALGVDAINVKSATEASSAITTIDAALATVSSQRSKLGAVQNRLESTINNLTTTSENLTAAESRIRDVDMASEMAEYTKLSVVTQAATAMLAQANQQPQQVLTLLK